ncbi:hypothetical protein [Leptothermofonsia sp. ETS-13]|uniref:hypothetical protein n=1 Tax=Leptothermofonsia sp. ETS-13 TaxID=3035696 RepID=UPI003BA18CB5
MKNRWLSLGMSLGFFISSIPAAFAVQPAPISGSAKVSWSKVVEDPFDGKIVYDKNFTDDFEFVSSWSKSGIRATYIQFRSEFVGYRTTWRTRTYYDKHGRRRYDRYPDQEPIYRRYSIKHTPKAIKFAINGQIYTYEEGAVPLELAAALASAPPQNMVIRLIWDDGRIQDIEIGRGTVEAWKAIFRS